MCRWTGFVGGTCGVPVSRPHRRSNARRGRAWAVWEGKKRARAHSIVASLRRRRRRKREAKLSICARRRPHGGEAAGEAVGRRTDSVAGIGPWAEEVSTPLARGSERRTVNGMESRQTSCLGCEGPSRPSCGGCRLERRTPSETRSASLAAAASYRPRGGCRPSR